MADTEKSQSVREKNAVARTVCEVCRADPGHQCVTPNGEARRPHIARRYADHKRHCEHCGRPR